MDLHFPDFLDRIMIWVNLEKLILSK
jgi:hypothetical protein